VQNPSRTVNESHCETTLGSNLGNHEILLRCTGVTARFAFCGWDRVQRSTSWTRRRVSGLCTPVSEHSTSIRVSSDCGIGPPFTLGATKSKKSHEWRIYRRLPSVDKHVVKECSKSCAKEWRDHGDLGLS
jgi:hypothetical protein